MRKQGAGQRWEFIEGEALRKHDLTQLRTADAPLEQTFARPGEKPAFVNLTFLSVRPELARVLANAFWTVHQDGYRTWTLIARAHCLRTFNQFLNWRARSQPDVRSAKDLMADLLKEMAVWLLVERRLKRNSAKSVLSGCCWFLRKARRLYPEEFDPFFSTPSNLFAGASSERPESKALPLATFQRILAAAEQDVEQISRTYKPGDVPASDQLIPFLIMLAARTGINPEALYGLERDCLIPHEIDDECFYCVWDKPRAGKQQKQLHRVDRRTKMGVIELIQFVRQYTEPLAQQADSPDNNKLFLCFSENTRLRYRTLSRYTALKRLRKFRERHGLPRFNFANMRPSAATLLYLQTGGNLGKVRQFLQHAHFSTTVRYVLNHITQSFNARVIQKAQASMVQRITVIPEKRETGITRLNLPRAQAAKIVAGRFDTSCGACRDPYDSPQPGEEKGRLCTAFHACFTCPHGLWFLDDLPLVIATRDRFLRLRSEMKPGDWDAVYGDSVRIIDEHIVAAFRPEQIETAKVNAMELEHRLLVVAKGVLG
jgi:integrase